MTLLSCLEEETELNSAYCRVDGWMSAISCQNPWPVPRTLSSSSQTPWSCRKSGWAPIQKRAFFYYLREGGHRELACAAVNYILVESLKFPTMHFETSLYPLAQCCDRTPTREGWNAGFAWQICQSILSLSDIGTINGILFGERWPYGRVFF